MGKWWLRMFRRKTTARRSEREHLESQNREVMTEVRAMGAEVRTTRENLDQLIEDLKQRRRGRND